jgi:hypothetical protein
MAGPRNLVALDREWDNIILARMDNPHSVGHLVAKVDTALVSGTDLVARSIMAWPAAFRIMVISRWEPGIMVMMARASAMHLGTVQAAAVAMGIQCR